MSKLVYRLLNRNGEQLCVKPSSSWQLMLASWRPLVRGPVLRKIVTRYCNMVFGTCQFQSLRKRELLRRTTITAAWIINRCLIANWLVLKYRYLGMAVGAADIHALSEKIVSTNGVPQIRLMLKATSLIIKKRRIFTRQLSRPGIVVTSLLRILFRSSL